MLPAAGPAGDQATAFDDLLDCSICYTAFQRPLQLNCGHSFCSNCVDQMCAHERNEPDYFPNADHIAQMVAGRDMELVFQGYYADRLGGLPPMNVPGAAAAGAAGGLGGAQEAEIGALPRVEDLQDAYQPLNFGRRPFPIRRYGREFPRGAQDRNGARHVDIKCPECRRTTRVPPEGLPVNYRLQDMIARLNINKTKTVKRDLLKCETCLASLSDGSFFLCKSDTCTQVHKERLCPICAIRHHNGHPIDEVKILGEKDITEAKDAINMHTARAHEAVEQIEAGFGELAAKAKGRLANIVKNGMKTFEHISRGLDNQVFTSHDSLTVSIEQAKAIADRYEMLTNTMNECVASANTRFAEIAVDLLTFFRNAGFSADEIKREPGDADPVLIEPVGRTAQMQNQNAQYDRFHELMRQAQRDERDRDRRGRGVGVFYQQYVPQAGGAEARRLRERRDYGARAVDQRVQQRYDAARGRAQRPEFARRFPDDDMPEEPVPPVVFQAIAQRYAVAPAPPQPLVRPMPHPVDHVDGPRIIPLHRQENPGPRDPRAQSPPQAQQRRAQTPMPIGRAEVKEEPISPPRSPIAREEENGPPVARRTRRARRSGNMNPTVAGPSNVQNNNNNANNNNNTSEEEPNTGAQQQRAERRRHPE